MTTTVPALCAVLLLIVVLVAFPTPTRGSLPASLSGEQRDSNPPPPPPLPGALTVSGAGGPFITPLMNYFTDAYQVPLYPPKALSRLTLSPLLSHETVTEDRSC
jgi:hypothetical protein